MLYWHSVFFYWNNGFQDIMLISNWSEYTVCINNSQYFSSNSIETWIGMEESFKVTPLENGQVEKNNFTSPIFLWSIFDLISWKEAYIRQFFILGEFFLFCTGFPHAAKNIRLNAQNCVWLYVFLFLIYCLYCINLYFIRQIQHYLQDLDRNIFENTNRVRQLWQWIILMFRPTPTLFQ